MGRNKGAGRGTTTAPTGMSPAAFAADIARRLNERFRGGGQNLNAVNIFGEQMPETAATQPAQQAQNTTKNNMTLYLENAQENLNRLNVPDGMPGISYDVDVGQYAMINNMIVQARKDVSELSKFAAALPEDSPIRVDAENLAQAMTELPSLFKRLRQLNKRAIAGSDTADEGMEEAVRFRANDFFDILSRMSDNLSDTYITNADVDFFNKAKEIRDQYQWLSSDYFNNSGFTRPDNEDSDPADRY